LIKKAPFIVYNASAGSGKTFSLVKSFLSKVLASSQPDAYKHLLAITFTNKAVAEMKSRILDMLVLFSKGDFSGQSKVMSEALQIEIEVSQEIIQQRSAIVIRHLLNNYALFSVETIDHFNHRLLRTFARDLKLNSNFEVSLDTSLLLSEAVDRLIEKAGKDEAITKFLVQYALQKTDDDKSWDISLDLKKAAALLTKENDQLALEKLRDKSLAEFDSLKSNIQKLKAPKELLIQEAAQNLITRFENHGLSSSHFDRGYLYKYFDKLAQGNATPKFDAVWQGKLGVSSIHASRANETEIANINALVPEISATLQVIKEAYYSIQLGDNILKNLVPLATVHLVDQEFQIIKEEENILPISDFNTLIHKEIQHQPAPFIYERLGERYKHFFIDEFQDTSKLQWQNLIPLVENSLAQSDSVHENGSLMIVGDAKQSIYRWRGGLPEQFMELYGHVNPFPFVAKQTENLDTNYRSCEKIVEFNNGFFTFISDYFGEEIHRELYKEGNHQKQFLTCEGYVQLDFIDSLSKEENDQSYTQKSYEIIFDLLDRGYGLKDICILVRKKSQGTAISEFLAEKNIAVISEETLLLKNSKKVNALLQLIHLQVFPENDELKVQLLEFLHSFFTIPEDQFSFLSAQVKKPLYLFSRILKEYGIDLDFEKAQSLGVYESLEYCIQALGLTQEGDAYITYFMDWVFQFSKGPHSGKWEFLEYWELKKDSLSLSAGNGSDALSVMTIHKSKGLEFPVVVFPFAEQDIYYEKEPKLWYPFHQQGFEELSINFNKEVESYGAIGADLYRERRNTLELDSLNLLYVVLTRSQKELYIISKAEKDRDPPKQYCDFFKLYLQHLHIWSEGKSVYAFGEKHEPAIQGKELPSEFPFNYVVSLPETHQIKMAGTPLFRGSPSDSKALDFGTLFHEFMAHIKTVEDLAYARDLVSETLLLEASLLDKLQTSAAQIVSHHQLTTLFNGADEVCNEQSIITPQGIVRPDRLNFHENDNVSIIDYKTGSPHSAHESQIKGYALVLETMGFIVRQMIIVYVDGQEIVVNKL
jgi:ATP-dependent exoDNAse (exonuclease V) beta subunit